MERFERWEIIERWVFSAVGIALVVTSLWLLFTHRSEPGRIAAGLLLMPCSFWVFWQLFHEEKLGTQARVSGTERAMYKGWLWARRAVLGTVALLFVLAAIAVVVLGGPLIAAGAMTVFALVAGWVAAYGGGRVQSFDDDRHVHRERARRYD